MTALRKTALVVITGAALGGSSFLFANPPIEQGSPILLNQPGGVTVDDLVTRDQLRSQLDELRNELSGQDGQSLLLDRLQRMEQEVQSLRGENEELRERLRRAEQDARDRYADLDRRLANLQTSGIETLSGTSPEPAEPQADDSEDAQRAYRRGRDLIAERRYPEAADALDEFVADYPDSSLAADAWFWLGEVRTLLREYEAAEAAYTRVLDDYPDSDKRLDSLFKLGFVAERTGEVDAAVDFYSQVVDQAPDGSLGNLASQRLEALRADQ